MRCPRREIKLNLGGGMGLKISGGEMQYETGLNNRWYIPRISNSG
jgi:hypothetical protein